MTIADFADKYINALRNGDIVSRSIEDTADQLADVNRQQLLSGKNAEGNEIRPEYRYYQMRGPANTAGSGMTYAEYKNSINPLPGYGTPDLKFSGKFHEGIRFTFSGLVLDWTSTDSKTSELLAKYGNVLGVYENPFLQEYREMFLYPKTIENIEKALQ